MRALQLTQWQHEPEIREVPIPTAGPGQVVIKVAGAGACHSDLHVMDWPAGALHYQLPFTLGHETTGYVAQLGAGVTGWREGDAVAVYGPWGCGHCRMCHLSAENYCEHAAEIAGAGGGLGFDGGMAEYMLVPAARNLVSLGTLDPRAAAPLTDAGLTPYHAIKRWLALLTPGSTVVVIGVGGLGHVGIQITRALAPANIIAVDTLPAKLELARQIGVSAALLANDDAAAAIRQLTHGQGAELVLDFVGADATVALAAAVVRTGGAISIVGLAGGTLPVRFGALPFEATVTIPYWGTRVELMEVIALAEAGKIAPHVEYFALQDALTAYHRMRDGQLEGRAVIVPNG